jgi:hypothetical protein
VDETSSERAVPAVLAAGALSVVAAVALAVGSWVPSVPEVLGCTAAISGTNLLALNGGMIAALLLFGYVSLFHARELLTTRLGRALAGGIIAFWLVRAAIEFFIMDPTRIGFLVIPVCIGMAALYVVPVLWTEAEPAGVRRPPTEARRGSRSPGPLTPGAKPA